MINRKLCVGILTLSVVAAWMDGATWADWRGFLGPAGNGVAENDELPVDFAPAAEGKPGKNIAWRVPLDARSVGGPIVVGKKVFTSGSSGMEQRWLSVTAVDVDSGKVAWVRKVKATGRPFCHPTSANAAPTPCSDGERVFAFFSSNDLVCYNVDGDLQWCRGLVFDHPKAGNDVGMSSSPIVVDGVVVVQIECQGDSFAAGINALTGETLWEVPRPAKANWSSPSVGVGQDGTKVVLLQCSDDLVAIDPRSGSKAWSLPVKCSTIPTSVAAHGKIYVPSQGIKAFDLKKALDQPQMLWETSKISPNGSSVLVAEQAVYGINRTVLVCCNHSGELKWQLRLPEAGSIWATPVIAGNRLYSFAQDGSCFTVALDGEEGKLIATSKLGESVLGSPAVSGNAMFVRSVDALWKIAAQ